MNSKRAFDLCASLAILILVAPVLLIISVAILATMGLPVIYRQRRLGLRGRVFQMYKFRTMVNGAEHQGTGLFTYEDDPRVTPVGNFLRKLSLDELPQVVNVLKGEMSLVGPRPPVEYELGDFASFDENLKVRFTVLPGITGLAQVKGRNKLTWDQKIEEDMQYIRERDRRGLLYDVRILMRTVATLFRFDEVVEQPPKKGTKP